MASKSPVSAKQEHDLMVELWQPAIADDPEAFVMFNYPWGKRGTPLEHYQGPRTWQRDTLQELKEHIATNKNRLLNGGIPQIFQMSTVSGRGPGKSALVSWLTDWNQSCHIGATTIVTANTEQQLTSRTWAELGKWRTLALNNHWFDMAARSMRPAGWFEEAVKKQLKVDTGYYYAQAQLWSEENPDAFAGVHNPHGLLLLMDEASGIHESIWKVSQGFFTEPVLHRYWLAFSNGRRNTGSFFECFHKNRAFWRRKHIDSRDVEGIDREYLDKFVEQHGEDSDATRVEVKGMFPRQGDKQFISRESIDMAVAREIVKDDWAPLIMGVDVARFGDDSTVIRFRQGRDARSIPPIEIKGADNMAVANECARLIQKFNPDAVAIDAGNGTGVIDRLREMRYRVHEVWFGSKADSPEWANKRTEMWALMREWLNGGCIDDDQDLQDDLAGPEYKYMGTSDKQMLETKESMKSRGLASPDHGDALACTFSIRVARRDTRAARGGPGRSRRASGVDYDPLG